ncbi:MAG TPA: sulfate permease [bacterium]|nr:sulfate permease [bacterium]
MQKVIGFISFYMYPKLFKVLKEGYTSKMFSKDLFSGLTVGVVALPLAMAFAIASGATPEKGLYTAIIAGFLISFLGGSRYQIGGPTGAFIVIVFNVISKHGYDGLLLATLLAGIMLLVMGLAKLGTVIKYIPYPVTTGFTTGIGLLIFSSQVKDFMGITAGKNPPEFAGKWQIIFQNISTANLQALAAGFLTVAIILIIRKKIPRVPAAFTAVTVVTLIAFFAGMDVETIGSKFGSIPSMLPMPSIPSFTLAKVRAVMPDAITIALLAGIESLLSAVVADGMTGDRHDSNTELAAQGIANIATVFFCGIPATGAIARTATNIKSGAASPVSGIIHAVTLFMFMLLLAPVAVKIPLTALAGVLMVVSFDMSEIHRFKRLFKAPKSDAAVMVLTFGLTVLIDLTVAVQVGVMLAAILFMKRMGEVTNISSCEWLFDSGKDDGYDKDAIKNKVVPKDVEVYEINGPFFFAIADKLKDTIASIEVAPRAFILRMRHVPAIDATGINALFELQEKCTKLKVKLMLSGIQPGSQVMNALVKYGLDKEIGADYITSSIDDALKMVK